MSEQLSFDRKKGFVALPVEVLDIDLTPGAFRTLVELCRMANAEGFCWPSLEQLSNRLGRSKSAISGYIKELRCENLIDTQEQKTATGYNYRLKYRVTFWQEWRAGLRGRTGSEIERSVQPDERLKESKKHIHKNHSGAGMSSELDKLLTNWSKCFKGAPYPTAKYAPSERLLVLTQQFVDEPGKESTDISAEIIPALTELWRTIGLKCTSDQISEQGKYLAGMHLSAAELLQLTSHIRAKWPAHWQRFPSADQFQRLVKSSGMTPRFQKLALLQGYLNRWDKAQKTLQNHARFCSLEPPHVTSAWAAQ